MSKIIDLYINRFKIIINSVSEISENQIIVLQGAPDEIKNSLPSSLFADFLEFNKEVGLEIFNKEWFSKTFIELSKQKKYHILSYSQFSHLIEYIEPSFFKDRTVIIKDNLRKIFPISNTNYINVKSTENIEERDINLPIHHVEQLITNGNYYYVSKDLNFEFKSIDLFTEQKEIANNGSINENEVIDISIDLYAIDFFVNQCIENNTFNKTISVKLHKKKEIVQELITNLTCLNSLMSFFGGHVFLYNHVKVEEDYIESEATIQILKKYWGEKGNFRKLPIYRDPNTSQLTTEISQGKIVETIIKEYENAKAEKQYRDLVLTAPTGAGKSLLFQLPAFYISEKGDVTIVVSPLIALMKDQVNAIVNERGFEKITYLNSELSLLDRERLINQCKNGEIDILYLSPELLLSYDITNFIGERKLGLLVIDEAHLITTWGRDFRVDYWFLGNHIRKIRKYNGLNFPMVAVTATAIYGGSNDMVFDSIDSLVMLNPHIFIGVVKRNDIIFLVNNYEDFGQSYEKSKLAQTVDYIEELEKKTNLKTLVYAPYTSHVKKINEALIARGLEIATGYYGNLDKDLKEHAYSQFLNGEKQVMVSTKAFGMGVDISDIQVVYHHAPSGVLPDYVQEVGRLARNPALTGYATLNYSEKDKWFSKALHGMSALKPYQLVEVLKKLTTTYKKNKSQNLLISVDDFAYIFEDVKSLDQKVLTALMMIEKDYLAKYRFNVLIARPKKLFVKVFARVEDQEAKNLIKKFGSSISQISYGPLTDKSYKIIVIDLDKIWALNFANQSFPLVKAKFYKGTLFENIADSLMPVLKITFTLNDTFSNVYPKFSDNLVKIQNAFTLIGSNYFSENDLLQNLENEFNDSDFALKICKYLLSNYSGRQISYSKIEENAFLVRRLSGKDYSYKIMSNLHLREFSNLINKFSKIFSDIDSLEAHRFVTNKDSVSVVFSRLGYLLALFELGTFEIKGGENPMIFVRLNDPRRIEKDSTSYYFNSVLTKTLDRHYLSNRIFDHFFMNTFTNEERWNFIEDYFLGAEIDELIENHPGKNIKSQIDIIKFLEENVEKAEKKSAKKKINTVIKFPPNTDVFYNLNSMLTIEEKYNSKTLKVSKWLSSDVVKFDKFRIEHNLKIDKEVFDIMVSKLKSYPEYLKETLGLNLKIEFKNYKGFIKASIPYKNNPIEFYKWWIENTECIKMTFKEKIELFDKVYLLDKTILKAEHKLKIGK